jgi:peptidyl-prolyl cis-trans isomerase SurA
MLQRSGTALAAASLLIVVLAGRAPAQTKTIEEIVARVNADIILRSELEKRLATLREELAAPAPRGAGLQGAQLEQAIAEQSKNMLRDLIDTALLLQVARDQGMNADLELLKTMERMRQENKFESTEALEKAIIAQGYNLDEFKQDIRTRYLTGQVLGREVYSRIIVTVEEMRKYYEEHKKEFDRPEGIRISEIAVNAENRTPDEVENQRKKVEDALAAVRKGEDFAETAAKFSEAASAQDGGDLGFFQKGQLNKTLEDALAGVEKGQTSDVLKLSDGFAIFKVEDKHSGGVLPFELAQREIQDILFSQRAQPRIREYLTKLREEGFVQTAEGYVDTGAAPVKASDAESRKN